MTDEDRPEQHIVGIGGHDGRPAVQGASGHSRHRWMMLVCLAPLLLIAVALILTGSVGIGSTVFVVGCAAMMAVMMFAMGRSRH
jgi:Flp pilus assembly protein TadB